MLPKYRVLQLDYLTGAYWRNGGQSVAGIPVAVLLEETSGRKKAGKRRQKTKKNTMNGTKKENEKNKKNELKLFV